MKTAHEQRIEIVTGVDTRAARVYLDADKLL